MDFVFWTRAEVPHACRLQEMTGFADKWRLRDGLPLQGELTENATFEMNPEFPDDTLTPDCLSNLDEVILVSSRVKEFLEGKRLASVEYLSVTVRDLKGKTVKPSYFIVNPVGTVPLLRLDECEATMDTLDASKIASLKKFVVDESILKTVSPLFRAAGLSDYLMIGKGLAGDLVANGFVGNRWIDPQSLATGKGLGDLAFMHKSATAKI